MKHRTLVSCIFMVLLCASRPVNAACVLSGARPTVPLPTMIEGQEFSFVATNDCETLRFHVPGSTLTKLPKAGAATGAGRTYKVRLSESEWNSVVDEGDRIFRWTIIATTGDGVTKRLTTTNELNPRGGVVLPVSRADATLVGQNDYACRVAGAGDVDGDGRDDVMVGAPANAQGGAGAGAAYLVLGAVRGDVDLATADAQLIGEEPADGAGDAISRAGDVDANGHADLLVGAARNDRGGDSAGAAYLVLGPVTGTRDLSDADAIFVGEEANDLAGVALSNAGDVDADGRGDLLIGAPLQAEGGSSAGAAYLVLGPVTGTLDLSLADAKLVGEARANGTGDGESVSDAGDLDGDGHADLLVGAPGDDQGGNFAGAAYVVLGPVSGTRDLSLADAKLVGQRGSETGISLSSAGDVDADGHADVLIGAPFNDQGGWIAGAAYVVLGPVTATRDLEDADAKILGEEGVNAGGSVSGLGDVNLDGHDDLVIGAFGGSPDYEGATYVVLGPVTGTVRPEGADVKLIGEVSDHAGMAVAGAGDVDGDGRGDVLVGSIHDFGTAYLLYGEGL